MTGPPTDPRPPPLLDPPRTRPLTPADAAPAASLIHAAFRAQPVPTDPPSAALRETPATLREAIATGGGAGVERHGILVGAVLWSPRLIHSHLYFGRLAVHPACRGHGIGRALVAAAEMEARRQGFPRIRCSARLVLNGNRAFFAACGFREIATETHPGYPAPTSVVLEKTLPRPANGAPP